MSPISAFAAASHAAHARHAAASAVEQSQPNDGHGHTANDCDPVTYASNPPSSGTHYPDWTAYKGFLVHDLEHGAVVTAPTDAPQRWRRRRRSSTACRLIRVAGVQG